MGGKSKNGNYRIKEKSPLRSKVVMTYGDDVLCRRGCTSFPVHPLFLFMYVVTTMIVDKKNIKKISGIE
jgi:hypothetical protein